MGEKRDQEGEARDLEARQGCRWRMVGLKLEGRRGSCWLFPNYARIDQCRQAQWAGRHSPLQGGGPCSSGVAGACTGVVIAHVQGHSPPETPPRTLSTAPLVGVGTCTLHCLSAVAGSLQGPVFRVHPPGLSCPGHLRV